jgi:hypothetical protein
MFLPSQIPSSIWELLEQLYLDAANCQDSDSYAGLADDEKRTILKDFAQEQSVTSARWANITQNLLSAELDG